MLGDTPSQNQPSTPLSSEEAAARVALLREELAQLGPEPQPTQAGTPPETSGIPAQNAPGSLVTVHHVPTVIPDPNLQPMAEAVQSLNTLSTTVGNALDTLNQQVSKLGDTNEPVEIKDLANVTTAVTELNKKIDTLKPAPLPTFPTFETKPITDGLKSVKDAIESIRFPVAKSGGNAIKGPMSFLSATSGLTDVSAANPLPVTGTIALSGEVEIKNDSGNPVPVSGTFYQATQPISGTVAVSNFPATQAVTGTFWQATQPVSGPLTDTQLRATAVPVSGTFWQTTQPISVASLPLPSGAATSALQTTGNTSLSTLAGAVTSSVVQTNTTQINGVAPTMGAGASGTGTQRVILATDQAALPVNANQGTYTATNLTTAATSANVSVTNFSNVTVALRGTYAGATIVFEYTPDSSNYFPLSGTRADNQVSASTVTLTDNSTVSYNVAVVGATSFRVRLSAITSGTLTVGLLPTADSLYTAPSAGINNVAGNVVSTVASGVQKVGTADSAGNAFLSAANALNSTGTGLQAAQIVAQFDDTSPTAITENQFGNIRMSNNRNLYGTIRDAAGNERGANVNSSNELVAGGGIAHAAADSGNPIKVGAKAITSLKTTTLASNANRTDNQSDLDGALITRGSFPLGDLISERVSDTGGTSTAFTNFSAVASTKNYVRGYSVFNSSATAGYVDIRDGTAGSILWTIPLPAGGGANVLVDTPIFKGSANTALAYDVSAALSTVYISLTGFQSKVS